MGRLRTDFSIGRIGDSFICANVLGYVNLSLQMFEGQPAWKFQLAEDVAQYLGIEGARPPFKSRNYPAGMKE